jgi:signal transduction histidine kinase/signal recognition particle receptor subunit beta
MRGWIRTLPERNPMAIFNLQEKTINAKIVYYGPALGGKTTSLKWVHHVLDPRHEIELVSLNTEQDRTLFFDFLPISLGTIEGFRVKLQAFTVPGQVKYNKTRKYVLTGADAVVFVVDSQEDPDRSNAVSLLNLDENLRANGINPEEIPLVLQYNKRDVPDARPIEALEREHNDRGAAAFDTVAITGEGVFEAFTEIAVQTLEDLVGRELGEAAGSNLVSSLRDRLLAQLAAVHPEIFPRPPLRQSSRRRRARPAPFAAARELVGETEEEDLLRQAVNSNMEVAGLLAEVNEARQELRRKVEELSVLHEAGKALSASLRESRVLEVLLDMALAGAGTEHGSILVPRSDASGILGRSVRGFLEDPLVDASRGVHPDRVLPDAEDAPVLLDRESRPDLFAEMVRREPGLREVALVPITLEGRAAATLAVYRHGTKAAPLADRLPFLRAVSAQGAIALQNARLFARVERFNRELEAKVEERTGELRKALDELRVLDQLKDDFLSSISHELLTPLTSIRSFSEILMGYDGTSDEERQEFLSIIAKESDRLTAKLQDVLDLGRIEAGRVSWSRERVEVRPLLNEVFGSLKERILERRVRMSLRRGKTLPSVLTDPNWLARVLRHVLKNAIQWSPEGGQIGLSFREDGDRLRITVTDEGPGIPEDAREAVFDRFRQIGAIDTDKPAGAGLGLPLARAIVRGLGGSIRIDSGEPRGTRVHIELPRARSGVSSVSA